MLCMADWTGGEALAASRVWFGGDAEPHSLYIGRDGRRTDVDDHAGTGAEPDAISGWATAQRLQRLVLASTDRTPTGSTFLGRTSLYARHGDRGADRACDPDRIGVGCNVRVRRHAQRRSRAGFCSPSNGAARDCWRPRSQPISARQRNRYLRRARHGRRLESSLRASATHTETLDEALAEMVPQASSGPPTLPMVDGSMSERSRRRGYPRIPRDVHPVGRLLRLHPRQRTPMRWSRTVRERSASTSSTTSSPR